MMEFIINYHKHEQKKVVKIYQIYYSNPSKIPLRHILINILNQILKSVENNRHGTYLNYKMKLLIIFYLLPTLANYTSISIVRGIQYFLPN